MPSLIEKLTLLALIGGLIGQVVVRMKQDYWHHNTAMENTVDVAVLLIAIIVWFFLLFCLFIK